MQFHALPDNDETHGDNRDVFGPASDEDEAERERLRDMMGNLKDWWKSQSY
jgi:hypothetical protein